MGSEICPTKDLIQALMETLVDPSLPSRVENEPLHHSVQQIAAKQMHAVVLMYNYHHRKQQSKAEFVDFVAFCKLSVRLRETMMPFIKFTNGNEPLELNDSNKLSVTEKAIRDVCDISMALDVSRDVPDLKGWSISKVAVFLVDSKNESCLLQFGSVTRGVRSLIEKQLCLNSSDLVILGSHTVYSLSKEETAARFYMVRCSHISKDEGTAIEEILKSLQGPLVVKNIDGDWESTSAFEYFHLQPYAEIISSWFLTLPDSDNIDEVQSQARDNSHESCSKQANDKKYKQKEATPSKASRAIHNLLANDRKYKHSSMQKEATPVKISQATDSSRELHSKVANDRKCKDSSTQKDASAVKSSQGTELSNEDTRDNEISKVDKFGACAPVGEDVEMEDSLKSKGTDERDDKVSAENCNATTSRIRDEIPSANAELIEELQNDPAIEALQNALAILSKREQEMYSEIYSREVQFALLQGNIQKVSDALECMKSMSAPYGVSSKSDTQQRSRIKLIDSPENSSSQDLESMCLKNNWRLPRYLLEPSDGKFIAKVVVTEKDKFCFATSDFKTNPNEARESVAAQLVAKLRSSLSAND